MRSRITTDDYLEFDACTWDIVDTSPGQCVFCGVCTGHSLYGTNHYDYISYVSRLVVADGKLLIARSERNVFPYLESRYDRFVEGADIDASAPYTGWMLLSMGSFLSERFSGLSEAKRAMEARFEEGVLAETLDLSPAIEKLRAKYPDEFPEVEWLQDELRSQIQDEARNLLAGEYNCTTRSDWQVAKKLMWGSREQDGNYECAVCEKLRQNGILPIKPLKNPRKKRGRVIGYQIPGYFPQWVRDLAAEKGIPMDGHGPAA